MMTLEQLPPKGVKREQAILELGKDEANGELLLQLVNTEKGKCKTAAQKALAQLEYAPAAPLWAKLVKGKWMGSNIMSDACSDCVSEQIAPVILIFPSMADDDPIMSAYSYAQRLGGTGGLCSRAHQGG